MWIGAKLGSVVVLGSILAAVAFGAVALSAGDHDRDIAIAAAVKAAHVRGEPNPVLTSAVPADADSLRVTDDGVPVGLRGQVWVVTLSGTFDPVRPAPDGRFVKGLFHRAVFYVQNGRVTGGRSFP
jgi:hypothetical protein